MMDETMDVEIVDVPREDSAPRTFAPLFGDETLKVVEAEVLSDPEVLVAGLKASKSLTEQMALLGSKELGTPELDEVIEASEADEKEVEYEPFEREVREYFEMLPDACVNDCTRQMRNRFQWKGGFNAVANEILRIKRAMEE